MELLDYCTEHAGADAYPVNVETSVGEDVRLSPVRLMATGARPLGFALLYPQQNTYYIVVVTLRRQGCASRSYPQHYHARLITLCIV